VFLARGSGFAAEQARALSDAAAQVRAPTHHRSVECGQQLAACCRQNGSSNAVRPIHRCAPPAVETGSGAGMPCHRPMTDCRG